MLIRIEDTGLVNPDFTQGDIVNRFPTFSSLTDSTEDRLKKINGEFRADEPIVLNLTANNNGISKNYQFIPSNRGVMANAVQISINQIIYNFTASFEKPVTYSQDLKDLPEYKQLKLMCLSKGHKDFYIVNEKYIDEEQILSFYQDMELFSKTDNGSPSLLGTPKKHLNFYIRNVSINESVRRISYNLDCILVINF